MTITSGFAIHLHGQTVPVKLQHMLLGEYCSTKSSFHTNVRQIISQISIAKRLPKRLNLFTFSDGGTAEERGIAATTTCHRSSRAKVRPDHPVPILGRPCQRRWRTHARDQPPEQSSVGMYQEVLPGALRPAESTVETQGSTVESGGDGGPTIRVHDVGPPPRTLPVTEEDTPPTTPASYRVPPRARHLPTAFVRSGPQEDRVPKRGSYHSTTATSVRGSHGQTTRRAPPEAADGRKTRRGGRSRQGTPRAELDGLSQGRLPSVRSHRRLYGGQSAHIRS